MEDKYNNLNIQGLFFNNIQNKIKSLSKKEGFDILNNLNLNKNGLTEQSQKIIKENDYKSQQQIIENLRKDYQNSLDEYNKLASELSGSASDFINRTNNNNPYLNKIIKFNTGQVCYVTNQGVVKYIPSPEIWDSLKIPKNFIQLNIPWMDNYLNPGNQIPTNPPLISGTPIIKNQSLGNEGLNVYVSEFLSDNLKPSYLGCFNDDPNNNNIQWIGEKPNADKIGNYDYNECRQYAITSGYQYFALQNGYCGLSNNKDELIKNGDGKIYNIIPLWSTETYGKNSKFFKITDNGILYLGDENGAIIWSNNGENKTANCWWSGHINPDSLTATYGGNCSNVNSGNVSKNVIDMLKNNNYPEQLNLAINNSTLGDPSIGCIKSFDTAYQCGNEWKTSHIEYGEGQYFLYDCKDNAQKCQFILVLNDDGNLLWYRGNDPNNTTELIWSSNTSGKVEDINPNYNINKSKYGRNYLKTNETLAVGDYLSSNNGKATLILQSDGNLVLYTWKSQSNCSKLSDGNMSGGFGSNSVYDIGTKASISNIGKLGYIDENSELNTYDVGNQTYSNDYSEFKSIDAWGADIPNAAFNDANLEKCKEACNSNKDCAGFVLSADGTRCYPKTNQMYPFGGEYNINSDYNTYIRNKIPANPPVGVIQNTKNIDTIKFENYIKGNKLKDNYSISTSINTVKKQQLEQLQNKINLLANQINDYTKKFGSGTLNSETQSTQNISGLNDYIKDLKSTNQSIIKVQNTTNSNLTNIASESDLIVLQKSYNYMFWSILAAGAVLISMNIIKK